MITKNHPPVNGKADSCPSCGSYCSAKRDLDDNDFCNDCRPPKPANKIAEALEHFRNGQERYDSDPIFKQAIDSLAAGVGVYAVLDSVLRRLSHQSEVVTTLTDKLKATEEIKVVGVLCKTCRGRNNGITSCVECGGAGFKMSKSWDSK